jgi:hypothetical protein
LSTGLASDNLQAQNRNQYGEIQQKFREELDFHRGLETRKVGRAEHPYPCDWIEIGQN